MYFHGILLAGQQGFGYNRSMEQPTEKQTLSCRPTRRQMELLLILNPLEFNRTYKDAAVLLKISESAVKNRMTRLKKRCPVVYERFRKIRESLLWKGK